MNPSPMKPYVGEPGIARRALVFGETLVRYATGWIDDRRYIEKHQRFIQNLEQAGELDGLLEALGVTREQLRAFEISPLASAELLSRMMERVGLTGVDVRGEGSPFNSPELRCRTCGNWRQCRRWLDSEARDDGYRDFCPNAELLDQLRLKAGTCSPGAGTCSPG